MAKTHWKNLVDTRFIGAHTLPDGQDMTVTITSVARETHTMDDGKEDHYLVAQLAGHLPMILNTTNAKTIQRLYGSYIEDWVGKPITLYASTTMLNNDQVECLRIRPTPPRVKEAISNTRLKRALHQISEGKYTVAQLRERYEITVDQEAFFTNPHLLKN